MSQPRSNSRRFVNAAWSLLTFQLVASAGAVAVTGVAAFHVSNLVNGSQVAGPVDEAVTTQDEAVLAGPPEATPTPDTIPDNSIQTAPAAPAEPVNTGPGTLTLSPDGNTLYLSITDPDGVSGTPRIQWVRNGNVVPGASGLTYVTGYDDSNAVIHARADYVDGNGSRKSAVSQPVQIGVITP